MKEVAAFPLGGRPLAVWIDPRPRPGPLLMALDEALLARAGSPVLRCYRWKGPWVSIGCFVPRSEAETAFPGRPLVRRWTGGGIVDHADDWTYSLVIPRSDPLATAGTATSYRTIHSALARALTACGLAADLADAPAPGLGGLCFAGPVLADVVCGGRKVAGAAQRRTRHGLLHQGSLQGITIPDGLAETLASCLHPGPVTIGQTTTREVVRAARLLVLQRYGRPEWLDGPAPARG